jgi:hypothetical protein
MADERLLFSPLRVRLPRAASFSAMEKGRTPKAAKGERSMREQKVGDQI